MKMRNKDARRIIENLLENAVFSEREVEALTRAKSRLSSPWTRMAYTKPTWPGLYLCAVKSDDPDSELPYTIGIYKFDSIDGVETPFYKWDEKLEAFVQPEVLAWMPIPKFYNNEYVSPDDNAEKTEEA